MRVPRQQMEKARIEIIPMIDIIFFLLVFFMVSTLAITINRGLPVNLPKAASSQKDLRESFNVTVMQDGTLFLNKELTTLEQLGQQVRTSVEKEPELVVVIINADDQALHGAIVSVMDEVRLAGDSRLAIAVRPDRRAHP
jgi:biopolymer transport protein ExbD